MTAPRSLRRGSSDRMVSMAKKGNAASATVRRAASAKRNEDLLPVIQDLRAAGYSTPQQIAEALNERGITAARGGAWSAVQVRRILKSPTGLKVDAPRVTKDVPIQLLRNWPESSTSARKMMRKYVQSAMLPCASRWGRCASFQQRSRGHGGTSSGLYCSRGRKPNLYRYC
jgi:hypothetical protein